MSSVCDLKTALACQSVEDIILNPRGLHYFQHARWHGPFPDDVCQGEELARFVEYLADRAGFTLGPTQPTVDGHVTLAGAGTFRVHIATRPMAMDGPELTLRRIPELGTYTLDGFVMSPEQRAIIIQHVKARSHILIAGTTGSGKSTFLASLYQHFDPMERVLILEDSPELPVPNALSTKLLARQNRFQFRLGASWDLKHLVFESLRMRPDRILLGECRGPEASAIAFAIETGHKGMLTTIHASSPEGALQRFQTLVHSEAELRGNDYRHHWDLVVHITLSQSGQRAIQAIALPNAPVTHTTQATEPLPIGSLP